MYRDDLGYHNISMYVKDFVTLEVIDFITLVYDFFFGAKGKRYFIKKIKKKTKTNPIGIQHPNHWVNALPKH